MLSAYTPLCAAVSGAGEMAELAQVEWRGWRRRRSGTALALDRGASVAASVSVMPQRS
jgi:hypothetical protein